MISKIFLFILKYFLLLLLIAIISSAFCGAGIGIYFYLKTTKDLPKISAINDYHPKAVTEIFSDDGTLIAEAWTERRYPVSLEQIPEIVRKAFLAAEDANFYNHPGIDVTSIVRAIYVNFRHQASKQGASTITQQIVKSLLLSSQKTYKRKIKEAILSYQLERALSKDEIFSIYLNQIYLGATAYGVKAASKVYFHKELEELNIAEAAFLAGLPQKPSYLANPKNRKDAILRERYVLEQMYKNKMISLKEMKEALMYKLEIYAPNTDKIFEAPYFSAFALKESDKIFKNFKDNTNLENPGGYKIYTTCSIKDYNLAKKAVKKTLEELDKRQGWRGPLEEEKIDTNSDIKEIEPNVIYKAEVSSINYKKNLVLVRLGDFEGILNLKKSKWAKKFITEEDKIKWVKPITLLKEGSIIEVSLKENNTTFNDITKRVPLILNQTPKTQAAFVVANVLTGEVKTIIGGYSYKDSQFNRATQGLLQPGSGFKPFIYLGAIDYLNYTPATIVPDSPISMIAGDGKLWSPQNYDKKFIGPITLRTALERSRNVISVYLLKQIGIDTGISIARRFGITTEIGRNMSISLGSALVKPIELIRAYGVFAAGGWLADMLVITRIEDRYGIIIYEARPHQTQVIKEDSAFIMANMMKGVVERGTARRVRVLKRPIAGKTGTTNDQMDAWFIGYTPEWVAGGWVGYDTKKSIGKQETGGRAAAPMFIYFMKEFLKDKPVTDFEIPDGVVPAIISKVTGQLVERGSKDTFLEYFKTGTEPTTMAVDRELKQEYLSNDEF